jgi:2-dehydro-3-deoxyphosphogluconate aldolase/(4S)-4-hydroxy-2-oxoglutarate aldolase
MANPIEQLGERGVVPVVKIENADCATALADALRAGGLPCAEITFRTAAAEEAIRSIAKSNPEILLGAGTVLSVSQAKRAVGAGATFLVSPGFDPKVVDWAVKNAIPILPGIATATEILMALDKGLTIFKFFPAEALGGVRMLESLGAVFAGVKFVPTGGVTAANLATYLRLPAVHAVGGTWIASAKAISAGDFEGISRLSREAVAIVRSERKSGGRS